jgi:predicted Zn-dependent peptidase
LRAFEIEPSFQKSVLGNGVRVVTERHPSSRAVASGIFVDFGTRDEPKGYHGAAHFLEHMVFKGTTTRDAYDIARSMEAVGGEINAYTTREQTCFHTMCLKEHLPLALDVLSDLVSHAEIDGTELKRERDVVLQEISMSDEQLDELVFDVGFSSMFQQHGLGKSILGTESSLLGLSRRKLADIYSKIYRGENVVVAVAGAVDHDQVVDQVARILKAKAHPGLKPVRSRPKIKKVLEAIHKDSEQEHVFVGFPSVSAVDKTRFEAYIVNALLGGGMTSRLYQSIREKHGLSYTVYSYLQSFCDSGIQTIYLGTASKHLEKSILLIEKEISKLCKTGIGKAELQDFKDQLLGSIVIESEDVDVRMNAIGFNELVYKEYRPVDHLLRDLNAVTIDSINAFVKSKLDMDKASFVLAGSLNEAKWQTKLKKMFGE